MFNSHPPGIVNYSLVNFAVELEKRNFNYERTIDDLTQFYIDAQPEIAKNNIIEQIHGYYMRIALHSNKNKFPILLGYLQRHVPQLYDKLLPLALDVTSVGNLNKLESLIKRLLLGEFKTEMPRINKMLFAPALPVIRPNMGGMVEFIDSVRYSIATENWFGALFMALALPDICGVLTEGEGVGVGVRYRNWFDKYLKTKYDPDNEYEYRFSIIDLSPLDSLTETEIETLKQTPIRHASILNFSAADCYGFRCKALHQGLAQRGKDSSTRIEFSPTSGTTIHRSYINGKWWLSIGVFSEDVCKAVEQWLIDTKDDIAIQSRLADLMTV